MKLLVKRRWQKPLSALFEAYARNQERNKMYADVVYRAFHRANVSQISRTKIRTRRGPPSTLESWKSHGWLARNNKFARPSPLIIFEIVSPNRFSKSNHLCLCLPFLFISSRGGGENKSRSFPLENISFDACRFSRRHEGMHIFEGIFEGRGMLKRMQLCEAQSASQRGRISRRLCKYRERDWEELVPFTRKIGLFHYYPRA